MTGRKIVGVVGVAVAVLGGILIWGAQAPLTEDRDADGYYMSDPFTVDRSSYAIVTGDTDILRGRYETLAEEALLLSVLADPVEVRMQGTASGSSALFMGIAPTSAVNAYLAGVAHDEITSTDHNLAAVTDIEYTTHAGTGTPEAPGTKTIWVASTTGTGLQTLDWTIESGDWTAVIMNADATSPVTVELALGTVIPNIDSFAWATLTAGAIALIGGGLLAFYGLRRRKEDSMRRPVDAPSPTEPVEKKPTTTP